MRSITCKLALLASVLMAAESPAYADTPDFAIAANYPTWSVQIAGASVPDNSTLHLIRGQTYTFAISTSTSHPFWIKTDSTFRFGSQNGYTGGGLSTNGVTKPAVITFDVPQNAPDSLFYFCGNHSSMTGAIDISIFRGGFD